MLIANNGAVKSGTSWVQKMVVALKPHAPLPEKWARPGWSNPSIHPDQLEAFLDSEDFHKDVYVIKSHFSPDLAPVLVRDGVIIINCARSIPDMVLSYYHHQKRRLNNDQSLNDWMEEHGMAVAQNRMNYLRGWAPHAPTMHFELMFADPEGSAMRLAEIVGSEKPERRIRQIGQRSQRTPQQGVREGHHVRTGRPGAAQQEIAPALYAKLKALDSDLLDLFPERGAIPA